GPVYVSVPLDDWNEPALPDDALLSERSVCTSRALSEEISTKLLDAIDRAVNPALVLGPQVDVAAVEDSRVFDAVVKLSEYTGATVYVAPSPPRGPFPTAHPNFGGALVPGIDSVRRQLAGHDVVLTLGAAVFRYHRWEPGNYLEAGTQFWQVTQDPSEATRAPFGKAVIANISQTATKLADGVRDRGTRRPNRQLPSAKTSSAGMTGTEILDVLNQYTNEKVVYVNETTTLDLDYLERIVIDQPGQYHFPASGGLGFGLPAAVGMALGDPEATIVATVGDGSANYGITALYTAAQRHTRTVFVIVNNSAY